MCVEVRCGDMVVDRRSELLNLLQTDVWFADSEMYVDSSDSCLCIVDIRKTAWNAGYEIVCDGEVDDDPFQIVIQKKGAENGS